MKIPDNNFGNVVAEPGRVALAPQDNQVTDALGRVGQTGMQLAEHMQAAEKAKQRTQAASTLAALTNDMHDIQGQVGQDVADGRITAEDALPTYQKLVAEKKKARTEGLTADQMQTIDSHVITAGGTLERNLKGVVLKRTQADTGANLLNMGEEFRRTAMRDLPSAIGQWNTVVDLIGPAAGWDPVKQATEKQKFKEGAHHDFANATLEGYASQGDLAGIRTARATIEGPDGEPIDPAKRTALITKAWAYENGILAADARAKEKADRDQQARENEAVTKYNEAFDLMGKGRYFSQNYMNELVNVTSGTKMAKSVQELVKSQANVAGFASMPLPQQEAQLERMRAAGSDKTIGVDPMAQKVEEQFQKITDESKRAYKENPWVAAQERAVIKDATVITLNNVKDAQQILSERMKTIASVEVAAGRKISPLQPQEAEQIGRLVRALPPDQQSAALASFGSMVGDADRLTALARQIDDKDKVLGTAMMYANLQTTQGRYVSELILRGDRAIRDKAIMIDSAKETGWRGAIAKEIGDAFPNQEVRNKMIDAAYFIQAGFTAEGSGTDTSRAVRMAAGQIVERNNNKFPLPYGMEESDFNKRIKAIRPADLSSQAPDGQVFVGKTGIPVSEFVKQLPDAALVHAGQGRYNVRAGTGLVTNAQGRRITIMVK